MEAEPKYKFGDVIRFKKPSVWGGSTGEVHGFVPDRVGKFVYRITIGNISRWVTELYLDHYTEVVKSMIVQQVPTECKWCGCGDILYPATDYLQFLCQSSVFNGFWVRGEECAARVHGQAVEMQDRIKRAIEVLEGAERYDIITGYESYMERRSDGEFIEHEEADQALEILRGNSSESPDSSPVTADQLATEDYFEAVRQRVPWMTSIEHIEGLIEGYRQCGLMVWKAAEQIEKVFGGRNGQTK